jgi:hypothetical protein
MKNITAQENLLQPDGVIDLTPYVDAVPAEDLEGNTLLGNDVVEFVYRSADNVYDHVAFPCQQQNVFLVVVVKLAPDEPYGHHLLNLDNEYGRT